MIFVNSDHVLEHRSVLTETSIVLMEKSVFHTVPYVVVFFWDHACQHLRRTNFSFGLRRSFVAHDIDFSPSLTNKTGLFRQKAFMAHDRIQTRPFSYGCVKTTAYAKWLAMKGHLPASRNII